MNRWLAVLLALAWVLCAVTTARGVDAAPSPTTASGGLPRTDLLDAGDWQAAPADGVLLTIHGEIGDDGEPVLRLDYDFQGRGGWAAARRPLAVALPAGYVLAVDVRGDGPSNHLEVKLVDPSGDNVWWNVHRDFAWPAEWRRLRIKERQVDFAWGPQGGGPPGEIAWLEVTVTAGEGGRGSLWLRDLSLTERRPPAPPAGPPTASASGAAPGHPAAAAVDGDPATAWRPAAEDVVGDGGGELVVDLRGLVELGGLTLRWEEGRAPGRFAVDLEGGEGEGRGAGWVEVRPARAAGAAVSHLRLPEAEARRLRVRLPAGACDREWASEAEDGCGLAEVTVRNLEFGAGLNGFVTAVAAEGPAERGAWPRGFSGEAVYWTVVGLPGAWEEVLVTEDGVVGLGEEEGALEPFLFVEGRLWTWADVGMGQGLEEGYLPVPTVRWGAGRAKTEDDRVAGDGGRGCSRPGAAPLTRSKGRGLRCASAALNRRATGKGLAPAAPEHPGPGTPPPSSPTGTHPQGWMGDGEIGFARWDGSGPKSVVPQMIGRTEAFEGSSEIDLPVTLEATFLVTEGEPGGSVLMARYRVSNPGEERVAGKLFLAARPLQANPPYQFLNVAGGVAPIGEIACGTGGTVASETAPRGDEEHVGTDATATPTTNEGTGRAAEAPGRGTADGRGAALRIDGRERVWAAPRPEACGALAFDQGLLTSSLAEGFVPEASAVADPTGLASATLEWSFDLGPGESETWVIAAPLIDGEEASPVLGATPSPAPAPPADLSPHAFDAALDTETERWNLILGPFDLDLPPEAGPIEETILSSLAFIEIHRDGAAIQPGSRAYARSWIRDGALTGAALLRLGRADTARRFAEWFAPFQYDDGKVPCCVDRRGAGPVTENDSHGELIHLVRQVHRFTGDDAFADRMFPHVRAAVGHIDDLRRQRRTTEYESGPGQAYFGLLPESISHEGYSAKPVHSYWDDTFAYRGLVDAVELAEALGYDGLAEEWAAIRDEFRADFLASIERVRARDNLAWLPASADLGDFDPTSSTTLLDPGRLQPWLPRKPLEATFERFWEEISERRAARARGEVPQAGYTPYELRNVGAFLRLGWRDRALALLDGYLADRRPAAWNAWPEVVPLDPRDPIFVGDLPHGWVASDFVRSALDLFAMEALVGAGPAADGGGGAPALVLGAGVPPAWLQRNEGISVSRLATPWGEVTYQLSRIVSFRQSDDDAGGTAPGVLVRTRTVRYELGDTGLVAPPGGLVFAWPYTGRPAAARVDGEPVPLAADGTLSLDLVPRVVVLVSPAEPVDATDADPETFASRPAPPPSHRPLMRSDR